MDIRITQIKQRHQLELVQQKEKHDFEIYQMKTQFKLLLEHIEDRHMRIMVALIQNTNTNIDKTLLKNDLNTQLKNDEQKVFNIMTNNTPVIHKTIIEEPKVEEPVPEIEIVQAETELTSDVEYESDMEVDLSEIKEYTEYECKECSYVTKGKNHMNKHLKSKKHINNVNSTKEYKFSCDCCNYHTDLFNSWGKHIKTKKHLKKCNKIET